MDLFRDIGHYLGLALLLLVFFGVIDFGGRKWWDG